MSIGIMNYFQFFQNHVGIKKHGRFYQGRGIKKTAPFLSGAVLSDAGIALRFTSKIPEYTLHLPF